MKTGTISKITTSSTSTSNTETSTTTTSMTTTTTTTSSTTKTCTVSSGKTKTTSTSTTTVMSCVNGWLLNNDYCYKYFNTTMIFDNAQAYCASQLQSSYLLDITSFDEYTWAKSNLLSFTVGEIWVNIQLLIKSIE